MRFCGNNLGYGGNVILFVDGGMVWVFGVYVGGALRFEWLVDV